MNVRLLPSTFCHRENFLQHQSILCAAGSSSVNFSCGQDAFHQLQSNFRAAERSSVTFCQHSLCPGELSSTSVNLLFWQKTFCELPCGRENFCQLPSTFCAAGRPSINFRQLVVCRETNRQLSSTLGVAGGPSNNLRQPSVWPEDCLSTFCAVGRHSINFHQISVQLEDLP